MFSFWRRKPSTPAKSTAPTVSRLVATSCGHETERSGEVSAFGHTVTTEMLVREDNAVDYCLGCIGKMAILCAWCGEPIFIGEPIILYTPSDKGFEIPGHAVVYSRDPLQLVGCLRWNCAETGANRAGFWVPGEGGNGRVERMQFAIKKIQVGSMVIVDDVHNMGDEGKPRLIPLE